MPGRNRSHESESTVDLTRRYLSELGSYPLLTAEQEVELAQAIETGRLAEIELSSTDPDPGAQGAALTAEIAGRRGGAPHVHPVQPAPGGVDRQALPGHRA